MSLLPVVLAAEARGNRMARADGDEVAQDHEMQLEWERAPALEEDRTVWFEAR
jgi:hypothetical protein